MRGSVVVPEGLAECAACNKFTEMYLASGSVSVTAGAHLVLNAWHRYNVPGWGSGYASLPSRYHIGGKLIVGEGSIFEIDKAHPFHHFSSKAYTRAEIIATE